MNPWEGKQMTIDLCENASCTRILVLGVGGGGCNSINRMIDAGIRGVEFIAINTDKQALRSCKATKKITIGDALTGGRGAGAVPDIGEKAALESEEILRETIKGSNMVFIAAGMGGGTGTGAAPVIAKIARDMGCLTIGVVTTPFRFEKKVKAKIAEEGISNLKQNVDTLITISNEALLSGGNDVPLIEAWRRADNVLKQGVQGISDLIINPGEINIDFADVRTVMKDRGQALMGIGLGKGENAAIDAVTMAIQNPLMPDLVVSNAKAILVNVCGSSKMTLGNFNDVMDIVDEIASENALVIPGQSFDESLEDNIQVTIVATGFEEKGTEPAIEENTVPVQQELDFKNDKFVSIDEFLKMTQPRNQETGQQELEEPAFMRLLRTRRDETSHENNSMHAERSSGLQR
jgi:cell division protein FtsZ